MNTLKNLKFDHKILLIGFVVLGLICFALYLNKADNKPSPTPEASPSVDTFIPRGYVLVPIELVNADSLGSLVGDLGGVVDLYSTARDKKQSGSKIATRLKILRAPLNPQQYAVLVRETESAKLLNNPGPFIAVIQNPGAKGAELAQAQRTGIQIHYQN